MHFSKPLPTQHSPHSLPQQTPSPPPSSTPPPRTKKDRCIVQAEQAEKRHAVLYQSCWHKYYQKTSTITMNTNTNTRPNQNCHQRHKINNYHAPQSKLVDRHRPKERIKSQLAIIAGTVLKHNHNHHQRLFKSQLNFIQNIGKTSKPKERGLAMAHNYYYSLFMSSHTFL